MIRGFGIDIIEIKRIQKVIENNPRFIERIFCENEREYCRKKSKPFVHYALRFAAKEAVAKVLGTGIGKVSWQEIEVARQKNGKPGIVLNGKAEELAKELGINEIMISLSYTRENAVASAIAL